MAAIIEDAQVASAPAWDEAKCEDALAQLETLQEQVRLPLIEALLVTPDTDFRYSLTGFD